MPVRVLQPMLLPIGIEMGSSRFEIRWIALRILTIMDVFTRESVAIEVGQSLRGEDVVRTLNKLKHEGRVPKLLFCDNGSEFAGQAMDLWAYQNSAKIDFSRPGKPTDNAFIESFNGTFRDECLNVHWFETLAEAKQLIEAWRREHNGSRPHRALGERTPNEFANLNQSKTNIQVGTNKLGPSPSPTSDRHGFVCLRRLIYSQRAKLILGVFYRINSFRYLAGVCPNDSPNRLVICCIERKPVLAAISFMARFVSETKCRARSN